jgi:hypothetical protein
MYNKWLQAVGHALTFDRIDDTALDIGDEPYCSHLIMLFTQLSTLAMLKLHSGHATDDDWLALGSDQGPLGARARHGSKKSKPLKKQATARTWHICSLAKAARMNRASLSKPFMPHVRPTRPTDRRTTRQQRAINRHQDVHLSL